MITNERQYEVTKGQVAKFQAAIDEAEASTAHVHARARQALRGAAQSQLDDLLTEREAYERLRGGQGTNLGAPGTS